MKLSLFFIMLLFTGIANATDYYVSNSGNDSNNGISQSTAWKTLSKVQTVCNNGTIKAGDNIYFKKGDTFSETFLMASIWGYHANSGTADKPITFSTYGSGAKPIFQYPPGATNLVTERSIIWLTGVNYIVFDGINFTDLVNTTNNKVAPAYCAFALYLGISGEATTNHCTIKNIDVSLLGMGIAIVGDFNTITNSTLTNFKNLKSTHGGGDDYGANPFSILSGNDNNITNNYVSGGWAESLDFGYNGGFCEMYGACNRNKFMYNTIIDCNGLSEYGGTGSNLDNLYAYNKLIDCGAMYWVNSGAEAGNIKFFNNTVIETNNSRFSFGSPNAGAGVVSSEAISHLNLDTYMFAYDGSPSASVVFNLENNIFQVLTPLKIAKSNESRMSHDYNVAKLSGGSSFGLALNTHDKSTSAVIFTNTIPANASSWDLNPPPGSPEIDAGTNVGIAQDFIGNPVPQVPNAGILEGGSGPSSTLNVTSTAGIISCNAGTTTITVTATGGTVPYTGTGTFTVIAGSYTYTVTDAAGTVKTTSITVSQPTAITVSVAAPGVYSATAKTTATITAGGGTPGYTYSLDAGAYQSGNVFLNVAVGNHSVKVKDSRGCISTKSFTVSLLSVDPLVISSTSGFILCNGGTTTITINATGGLPPYSGTGVYTVSAGTQTFTVTDAAGTTVTKTITTVQPKPIVITVSTGSILTYGGSTTATITATGGTGSTYSYKLNTGPYQSSNTFSNITAGSYTVTVKDARNCTSVKSFTITQPAQSFQLTLVYKTNVTCNGSTDGKIQVAGNYGTQPYVYKKSNGNYSSNSLFTNLAPGTYIIKGKDASGATSSISVTIANTQTACKIAGRNSKEETFTQRMSNPEKITGLELTAFPNPTSNQFSVIAKSDKQENIHITVLNMNGQKVYENSSVVNRVNIFGNDFVPGIYFLKAVQADRVQIIKLIKTQ